MADKCISCNRTVTARQEAIQCDGCLKWNHRTCNTGITQQAYREAVRAGADISWCCLPCHAGSPVAESSRISEQSIDTLESSEFNQRAWISEQSIDILESSEFNPRAYQSCTVVYSTGPKPCGERCKNSAFNHRILMTVVHTYTLKR
ncbi:uncharacterized protein [Montipora foliosa]|uniref:uncharacterized protein n=1 Tax=Montipora foliosa TaxID=591990 RepID=UPI0035F1AB26